MSAVCVKCGGFRSRFDQICPSCGHRPTGEGLLVAWLLSSENLDADGLQGVSERIRAGESIRPSRRMLLKARRAMRSHFSTDPGMSAGQVLGLLATNLLVTPLVGWILALWWREDRPRAALQAFAVSLPCTVLFTVLVFWLALGGVA